MSLGIRRPFEAVDFEQIQRSYPPPPEYFESEWYASPDEIAHRQLVRLRERVHMAYRVPFFRKRWDDAGFSPGDLQSLDDLWKAPFYTVDDLRQSIEENPPLGDYQGASFENAAREPVRIYMSGATTGVARPTLYTQWDREVGAILTARVLYMQGVRPGDIVLNSWAYATHNGAHHYDEAAHRWLSCAIITTGTGTATSSRRQIELARLYGATAIMTTGDYLLHLADVAREMGYDPKRDFNIRALPNIGDKELLTETWGPEVYDQYGFHEVGAVSVECPARQGLHIFEDAFVVQIVDVDTGEPLPDGELGSICLTEIYKTGSPQIRYNIMDLSFLYPPGQCECGSWLRRMGSFAGRGDNMVKLRGVNVWPENIGRIATSVEGAEPEYFVRASREGNRETMVVTVTSAVDENRREGLRERIETRLKEDLGVRIGCEVVGVGGVDEWTEIHTSPKPKRFRDER